MPLLQLRPWVLLQTLGRPAFRRLTSGQAGRIRGPHKSSLPVDELAGQGPEDSMEGSGGSGELF